MPKVLHQHLCNLAHVVCMRAHQVPQKPHVRPNEKLVPAYPFAPHNVLDKLATAITQPANDSRQRMQRHPQLTAARRLIITRLRGPRVSTKLSPQLIIVNIAPRGPLIQRIRHKLGEQVVRD